MRDQKIFEKGNVKAWFEVYRFRFITFYSIKCTLFYNGMFIGKIYFNED